MRKKDKAEEDLSSVKQRVEKKWQVENLEEMDDDLMVKDVVLVGIMKKDPMEIDVVTDPRVVLEQEVADLVLQNHLLLGNQQANHVAEIIIHFSKKPAVTPNGRGLR